jgi:AcrR family transcriptional regulator
MVMTRTRMNVDDRRREVLEAAMHEFAQAGYDSVSAQAIADRAGVSQPYVFRLFGTKKDLFLAAIEERTRRIVEEFRQAAEDSGELSPMDAMAGAYVELLTNDPDALRCQLFAWASASDPEIGAVARASYLEVWKEAGLLSGEDPETVRDFMAEGMLLTVLAALDIPHLFLDPSQLTDED